MPCNAPSFSSGLLSNAIFSLGFPCPCCPVPFFLPHLKYKVLDVGREYVGHHGLGADDPLRDVLLRVLVALDGERRRARQQLVRQHAEAPPVDGLRAVNES